MRTPSTVRVPKELFEQVYDSPASLPGKQRWLTSDEDVRRLEEVLEIPPKTIGAPLWVSGDERNCPNCQRELNWLDIVGSAIRDVHDRALITRVILGRAKYVNTDAPRAIAGVRCFDCGAAGEGLRSFKCHNWAYAYERIDALVRPRPSSGQEIGPRAR
jgi:hypothetical protein